jgi:purine-cytosine permease-like protein
VRKHGASLQLSPSYTPSSRYLVTIPLLLNAATVTGFSLASSIVGGQTLASLDPDKVSVNIGIVIACLVSFAVSLLGFHALHFWQRWTWVPNLISIVIAVGCGGKHLHLQSDAAPATPAQVLSYGGLIAGYFVTFGGTVSDYSIYHNPRGVSKYASSPPPFNKMNLTRSPDSKSSSTSTRASSSPRSPS